MKKLFFAVFLTALAYTTVCFGQTTTAEMINKAAPFGDVIQGYTRGVNRDADTVTITNRLRKSEAQTPFRRTILMFS